MFEPGDHLLELVSAKGKLSWQAFTRAFDLLSNKSSFIVGHSSGIFRYYTARAMEALGYLDTTSKAPYSGVYATPLALVRLPSYGRPQAFLSGSRRILYKQFLSDKIADFDGQITFQESPDNRLLLPTSIHIKESEPGQLLLLARRLGIPFFNSSVSQAYLQYSGTVVSLTSNLQWLSAELKFNKRFDPSPYQMRFNSSRPSDELELVRLSTGGRSRYFLIRNSQACEIDPDWGRYVVLYHRKSCVLSYDRRNFTLTVPASIPLPKIIERGLCFRTGNPPEFIQQAKAERMFLRYSGIPSGVATLVAKKLGQELCVKSH